MRHARLWRSTPFRLAMTFGLFFVVAFIVTGLITYQFLKRELLQELDQSIREIHSVVATTYAPDDIEDMISTVNAYVSLTKADERIFSVLDAKGNTLAGNFDGRTVRNGISEMSSSDIGLGGDVDYRLMAGAMGDKRLVVGQSFGKTDRLEDIASASFAWATLLVIVFAIVGGILLAFKVQKRLDGIANAMNAVSHGELQARVPLNGNGDDIDTVSSQINQALDRLSVLVETMRQVSSDIAHDLKTPLNRLKMQIEIAVSGEERGESVSEALTGALEEADQINATFEALLRISQIEAGARKTRFTEVNIAEVMRSVGEIYTDVADDNGQTLVSTIDASAECWVHGDKELLTQMFVNLIENAIRHCPADARIDLALATEDGTAIATISDTGPGIPAEERDKVFRRLYRIEKSRTTSGSGLGLSLVRAIVDLHGGRVEMKDNHPGARAEVRIPMS